MLPIIPLLVAGAVVEVGGSVISTAMQYLTDDINPERAVNKGRPDSSISAFATGDYCAKLSVYAPSEQDLRAIDNYFKCFGVAVNRFEKPNLNVMDDFTYIKTSNARVSSHSTYANNQLSAMLNAGTTFHKAK